MVGKYFEDDYSQRYSASDILAKQFGAYSGEAHSTVEAKHVHLTASSGEEAVHIGQRIALALDIDIPPRVHVYAPGVQGYIPIDFAVGESSAIITHAAIYPPSKTMHLKVIDETVPVYTGKVRLLREITIAKGAKPGALIVDGTFRYQACDDRECFIPETVPLKWMLNVEALDRQRAPEAIQHK